ATTWFSISSVSTVRVSPPRCTVMVAGPMVSRIVAIDGRDTPDWNAVNAAIRETIGPATITVQRGGETLTVDTELIENQVVA
ncbi:hypothetical protein DEF24_27555, partial [Marinitenerispora sediminis]